MVKTTFQYYQRKCYLFVGVYYYDIKLNLSIASQPIYKLAFK
jgi:hypothetical protein